MPIPRMRSTTRARLAAAGLPLALAALPLAAPPPDARARTLDAPGSFRLSDQWPHADVQSPAGTLITPAGLGVAPDGTLAVADGGNARVQLFAADGTFSAAYGQPGGGPGQLVAPQDVAITADRVFVTDPPSGRVQAWFRDGSVAGTWTGFGEPWGIAATGDGRLLVTDRARGEIAVLDLAGTRLATWGRTGGRAGEYRRPAGIDVAPDGEVMVADTGNGRYQVLSPQGRYRDEFRPDEVDKRLAGAAHDVASDGRGNLYAVVGDALAWLRRDGARRVTLDSLYPVTGVRAVALDVGRGVFASRAGPGIGEVVRQPHTVRGAAPDLRFGSYGGELGRFVAPRHLARAPDGDILVLSTHGVGRYGADGTFRSLLRLQVEDVTFLPGGDLLAVDDARVRRVRADGSAVWSWPATGDEPMPAVDPAPDPRFSWFTHVVFDPAADRAYVLDVGGGLLLTFTPDGELVQVVPIAADGTFAAYRDMALNDQGWLILVNQVANQVELRSPDGALRRALPLRGVPDRADVGGGRLFVLTEDGWVWRYGADLELELAWDAVPGGHGLDLKVVGDDVFVLDARHNQVLRWSYDPAAPTSPPPAGGEGLRCSVTADRSARPGALLLGEAAEVTLRVGGGCPERAPVSDIALVMDRSGSMLGEKIAAAQAAALTFLDLVDFSQTQVALVAFSHEGELVQPLTDDPATLRQAVRGLSASGGTDIAAGIEIAHFALGGDRHRPGARRTLVLLTDGNSDTRSAVVAALGAKLDGAWLFTIGLGTDVNNELLSRLATSAGDYYVAPDAADLARVYGDIGRRLRADGLLRAITVHDELPPGVAFAGMVAGPPPQVAGRALDWTLGRVGFDGLTLTYRVRPERPGHQALSTRGDADYLDGLGRGGWRPLPIPWLTVLEPTRLPTPSPTATPVPVPIFLPVTQRNHCISLEQHADVVLALDASYSMNDPTPGGRSKLSAAVAAARAFVDLLALPKDQVGLVTFNTAVTVAAPLGASAAQVHRALDTVATAPGTRIDLALEAAAAELGGPAARPRSGAVIVLLTDGHPTGTTSAAVIAGADRARALGVEVFAVGLGTDVDPEFLAQLADGPEHRFLSPSGDDLERIYRHIAGVIPCR